MGRYIIIDSRTQSYDSEDAAIAALKDVAGRHPIGRDWLGSGDVFVVEATIVRKIEPSIATGPGGDHQWFDHKAERERARVAQKAAMDEMGEWTPTPGRLMASGQSLRGFGSADLAYSNKR